MEEGAIKRYLDEDYAKAIRFYDNRSRTSKLWYRLIAPFSIPLVKEPGVGNVFGRDFAKSRGAGLVQPHEYKVCRAVARRNREGA